MHASHLHTTFLAALLFVAGPPAVDAAEVLTHVPGDALGFVLINDLGTTDDRAAKLLQSLQLQFPGPLALLKLATGVSDGLDSHGDLLLVILPGKQPTDRPQFGIWLPVSDYRRFVLSLDGTPANGISAITVAGEDLLIASHNGWAVVMDPDQRDRLQTLLAAAPAPPSQITAWSKWIDSNQVTAMLLPNGWHTLWGWAAANRPAGIASTPAPAERTADDIFGPPTDDAEHASGIVDGTGGSADDFWSQLQQQIRDQLRDLPQLARWAAEADAIACGVRMDDDGNAVAGVRVAVGHNWPMPTSGDAVMGDKATPPTLFQSGEFIASGTASLNGTLAVSTIGTYAHLWTEELKNEIQVRMDDDVAAKFQKAVEEATAVVSAASVLTRPGEKPDGTYSNAFLAVRTSDAKTFAERFAEVIRQWNEMNKSEEDESRLVFEKESAQIGGQAATVFSLDMVEAFGAAAIPEVRPSMERLFGPGGKLRLLVVPVDEHVVMLAAATEEQATPLLDVLAHGQPTRWDEATNRLLPREADWRLMVSPQGQRRWVKRQMEAMFGPVIGATAVRQFPPSPPVGAAGGFSEHEIWADAAVPADTIRATGQYLHQR